MRKLMIAALLAGQIAGARPAAAADFADARQERAGAFAGLRLRLPLDGNRRERRIRAGLTVAPTLQSRTIDGETRTRIGEGVEFGYRSGRPISFSIAGRDLQAPGGARNHDLSTGEILLIAGGVIVVTAGVVAVVFIDAINDNSD